MKSLILVQHCQSEHHVNGLTGGWTDTPLTELGRRQAASTASRLKRELADKTPRVYSSDLMRALQTAEIICSEVGAQPICVPKLREHNAGAATGKTREWADQNVDMSNWSMFDWHGFEGGETWREFHARVCKCMSDLWGEVSKLGDDHPPVIVTHGGTLSNIVTWWLGFDLDSLPECMAFSGLPGSITVVGSRNDRRVLERHSDTAHLYADNIAGCRPLIR